MKNRTLKEEIQLSHDYTSIVPSTFHITKNAEEDLYFFSRQMDCEMDEALDLLLGYLALTENCIRVLEDLGYKFDPKKS